MVRMDSINKTTKILLILTLLSSTASGNQDCGGKPFLCVNATHFNICVDFGNGVSFSVDSYVIPCPPGTECSAHNHFECEIAARSVPAAIKSTNAGNVKEERSVSTTPKWEVVTTNVPITSVNNTELSEKYLLTKDSNKLSSSATNEFSETATTVPSEITTTSVQAAEVTESDKESISGIVTTSATTSNNTPNTVQPKSDTTSESFVEGANVNMKIKPLSETNKSSNVPLKEPDTTTADFIDNIKTNTVETITDIIKDITTEPSNNFTQIVNTTTEPYNIVTERVTLEISQHTTTAALHDFVTQSDPKEIVKDTIIEPKDITTQKVRKEPIQNTNPIDTVTNNVPTEIIQDTTEPIDRVTHSVTKEIIHDTTTESIDIATQSVTQEIIKNITTTKEPSNNFKQIVTNIMAPDTTTEPTNIVTQNMTKKINQHTTTERDLVTQSVKKEISQIISTGTNTTATQSDPKEVVEDTTTELKEIITQSVLKETIPKITSKPTGIVTNSVTTEIIKDTTMEPVDIATNNVSKEITHDTTTEPIETLAQSVTQETIKNVTMIKVSVKDASIETSNNSTQIVTNITVPSLTTEPTNIITQFINTGTDAIAANSDPKEFVKDTIKNITEIKNIITQTVPKESVPKTTTKSIGIVARNLTSEINQDTTPEPFVIAASYVTQEIIKNINTIKVSVENPTTEPSNNVMQIVTNKMVTNKIIEPTNIITQSVIGEISEHISAALVDVVKKSVMKNITRNISAETNTVAAHSDHNEVAESIITEPKDIIKQIVRKETIPNTTTEPIEIVTHNVTIEITRDITTKPIDIASHDVTKEITQETTLRPIEIVTQTVIQDINKNVTTIKEIVKDTSTEPSRIFAHIVTKTMVSDTTAEPINIATQSGTWDKGQHATTKLIDIVSQSVAKEIKNVATDSIASIPNTISQSDTKKDVPGANTDPSDIDIQKKTKDLNVPVKESEPEVISRDATIEPNKFIELVSEKNIKETIAEPINIFAHSLTEGIVQDTTTESTGAFTQRLINKIVLDGNIQPVDNVQPSAIVLDKNTEATNIVIQDVNTTIMGTAQVNLKAQSVTQDKIADVSIDPQISTERVDSNLVTITKVLSGVTPNTEPVLSTFEPQHPSQTIGLASSIHNDASGLTATVLEPSRTESEIETRAEQMPTDLPITTLETTVYPFNSVKDQIFLSKKSIENTEVVQETSTVKNTATEFYDTTQPLVKQIKIPLYETNEEDTPLKETNDHSYTKLQGEWNTDIVTKRTTSVAEKQITVSLFEQGYLTKTDLASEIFNSTQLSTFDKATEIVKIDKQSTTAGITIENLPNIYTTTNNQGETSTTLDKSSSEHSNLIKNNCETSLTKAPSNIDVVQIQNSILPSAEIITVTASDLNFIPDQELDSLLPKILTEEKLLSKSEPKTTDSTPIYIGELIGANSTWIEQNEETITKIPWQGKNYKSDEGQYESHLSTPVNNNVGSMPFSPDSNFNDASSTEPIIKVTTDSIVIIDSPHTDTLTVSGDKKINVIEREGNKKIIDKLSEMFGIGHSMKPDISTYTEEPTIDIPDLKSNKWNNVPEDPSEISQAGVKHSNLQYKLLGETAVTSQSLSNKEQESLLFSVKEVNKENADLGSTASSISNKLNSTVEYQSDVEAFATVVTQSYPLSVMSEGLNSKGDFLFTTESTVTTLREFADERTSTSTVHSQASQTKISMSAPTNDSGGLKTLSTESYGLVESVLSSILSPLTATNEAIMLVPSNISTEIQSNRDQHKKETNTDEHSSKDSFRKLLVDNLKAESAAVNSTSTGVSTAELSNGSKNYDQSKLGNDNKVFTQKLAVGFNADTSPVIKPRVEVPQAPKHKFNCTNLPRGRYSDEHDCRRFYICIDKPYPIVGHCMANAVFSEIKKQCVRNMSHCIRGNEFKCAAEGRFVDYNRDNIYYICMKRGAIFLRYKFQCQNGYNLDSTAVKCIENVDNDSNSVSMSDSVKKNNKRQSVQLNSSSSNSSKKSNHDGNGSEEKEFVCKKAGKFPHENDCRKYYICSKTKKSEFKKRIRKCESDEMFNEDKGMCVDAESNECQL